MTRSLESLLFLLVLPLVVLALPTNDDLLDSIQVPPGFEVSYAATEIQSARYMVFSPDGKVLFVGSYDNTVYALTNPDSNGTYQTILSVSSSFDKPTGVSIAGANSQYLIVGTPRALFVYDLNGLLSWIQSGSIKPPNATAILNFEVGSQAHYLTSPPLAEDYLYFSFPSIWNSNLTIPLPYGTLMRINITAIMSDIEDARERDVTPPSIYISPEIVALGVRDSQGLAFSPVTGDLWFTDNGCEYLGNNPGQNDLCNFSDNNNLPPDELNRLPAEMLSEPITSPSHYGFPYCYGANIPDTGFPNYTTNCLNKIPSQAELEAHEAPLGLNFYPSAMSTKYSFPAQFYNTIFLVSHGSSYRQPLDGYDVLWVSLDSTNTMVESVEVFAQGWLQTYSNGTQQVLGRPDDVIVDPNEGSLLITDDFNSCIYRVRFTN